VTPSGGVLILRAFGPPSEPVRAREFFLLLICSPWTNLLILGCLSSVIGELSRRLLLGARQAPQVQSAFVRGFFILLAMMASQLVILGMPGTTAIPDEALRDQPLYADIGLKRSFRLAAFASLLSLLVSLKPSLIRVLIEHILSGLGDGHNAHPEAPRVR
jgi:hypothetical protein